MPNRPKAYEGDERYIFISYAHSDKEKVYKVLYELEKRGYRFWYDDGITPGSEWAEDIARHLNDAYVVIAFIAEASVLSDNCRREINYSLSKEKPLLSVVLEQTEMSAGLELQLSAQQSVIKDNCPSWDAFIDKILLTPEIAQCREEIPEPETEEDNAGDYTLADADNTIQPEAAAVPGRAEPKKRKAKKSGKTEGKKNVSAKVGLVLIIIAAFLAAFFLYGQISTVKMSWGFKYNKNRDETVSASNAVILQEDIDKLGRFKNLRSLKFRGCDFRDCDLSDYFSQAEDLEIISFDDCKGLGDFSFLSGTAPRTLSLRNQSGFTDPGIVDMKRMAILDLSGTGAGDISALKNAEFLYDLNISSTKISDLSPFSGLKDLKIITARNAGITSVDQLSDLKNLEEIDISGCDIGEINSRFSALSLKKLSLAGCGLKDLSAFSDCTVLTDLDLSDNPELEDLSWLNKQNKATLRNLNLSDTGLDTEGLTAVSGCPELKTLTLDGTKTDDLDICKGCSRLEQLSAQGCGIRDTSGLKGCKALEKIQLGFNEISDLGGLASVDPEEASLVDVSCNEIGDISGLPAGNYHTIIIAGNDKKLASTMPEDVTAFNLITDWYDDMTTSRFAKTENFCALYLIGTPADQKLKVEKETKAYSVYFITMEDLYNDLLANDKLEYSFIGDIDYSYAKKLFGSR